MNIPIDIWIGKIKRISGNNCLTNTWTVVWKRHKVKITAIVWICRFLFDEYVNGLNTGHALSIATVLSSSTLLKIVKFTITMKTSRRIKRLYPEWSTKRSKQICGNIKVAPIISITAKTIMKLSLPFIICFL